MKTCMVCGRGFRDDLDRCPACGASWSSAGGSAPAAPKTMYGGSDILKYAELMDDDAIFRAAVCHKEGLGMAVDIKQAKELFHILAMRGNQDGMFKYAEMCLAEEPADLKSALHWLMIAAQGGHISSRLKLLELSSNGVVRIEGGLTAKETFREAPAASPTKAPAPRPNESAFEALVRSALPLVVQVASDKNKEQRTLGSGFILDGGYVITNSHVLGERPSHVTTRFEPGLDSKTYEMKVLANDPDHDIGVLRFTGTADTRFASRPGLKLRLDDIGFGEEVYTIGNPLGIGLSVSKGVVSSPNRDSDYPRRVKKVIQTDITVNHGNSGGALLDRNNNVIGVITFVPGSSDGGIAMCVPSKYIVKVLNDIS